MKDELKSREQLIRELSDMRRRLRTAAQRDSELNRALEEQKILEEELRNSNEELVASRKALEEGRQRYFELFENAPVGYIITNEFGIIQQLNLAAVHLLGYRRKLLTGRPLVECVSQYDRKGFMLRLGRIVKTRVISDWELSLLHATGKIVHGYVNVKINSTDKSRITLQWVIRDISERKRLEAELRSFPSKLLTVLEDERKRLAGELHDSIGQNLAAVKFWMEIILSQKSNGNIAASLDCLEKFIPTLQRLIDETRSIYMGLRPSMLDSLGVLSTIDWLCRETQRLFPAHRIGVEARIVEDDIPEPLKITIFRITQEALNNVVKHSRAELADIELIRTESGIELAISDNGMGMDLGAILKTNTARSLGLTSMKERAELTGGQLSIDSAPGSGTTVRVCWPDTAFVTQRSR